MNAANIDELVAKSLAGERSVYAHHVPNPAEYVASIRERFVAARIAPALRPVVVQDHISHLVDRPVGAHMVYFVSEDSPLSVFYDPLKESFGAAWGPDASTGEYIDLGFRSSDVLEMASA